MNTQVIDKVEIAVEVCPCPLWDSNHKLKGYFAGIFGPNKYGDVRTYWFPALAAPGHLMRDPQTFKTPAAAMAAWESGSPRAMRKDVNGKQDEYHVLPNLLMETIEERGLLRE